MREKAIQVSFRVSNDKERYNRAGILVKGLVIDGGSGEIFPVEDIETFNWTNDKWYSCESMIYEGRNRDLYNAQVEKLIKDVKQHIQDLDSTYYVHWDREACTPSQEALERLVIALEEFD